MCCSGVSFASSGGSSALCLFIVVEFAFIFLREYATSGGFSFSLAANVAHRLITVEILFSSGDWYRRRVGFVVFTRSTGAAFDKPKRSLTHVGPVPRVRTK